MMTMGEWMMVSLVTVAFVAIMATAATVLIMAVSEGLRIRREKRMREGFIQMLPEVETMTTNIYGRLMDKVYEDIPKLMKEAFTFGENQ